MGQTSHSHHHPGSALLIGTTGDDFIHGGNGVADIHGWSGNDTLYGGLHGGSIAGGHGDDVIYAYGFGSMHPERFQTHAFGDWGIDTFYMDLSRHHHDIHDLRFGHHVFGGHGADNFILSNLAAGDQRIVGRIDDFDPTQDAIWVDNIQVDLHSPPDNVRIVQHLGQQWILIDSRILFALEGARHRSAEIRADGRNADAFEEDHFIYWPEEWANGVPKTADVQYENPVNFVPAHFLSLNESYGHHFSPSTDIFSGTEQADRIESSSHHGQHLSGLGGNDFIFGNRGGDTIHGGNGDDYIDGHLGHDAIFGENGNDTIDGGKGHDLIYGGAGDDVIVGGSDNDTIYGGTGNDIIFGGSEDDLLFGGSGDDLLYGGPGNDRLHGGPGQDIHWGGAGNDTLWSGDGHDTLYGGSGHDELFGGAGNDLLFGGPGNDTLHGGEGNDVMFSGLGNDTIFGGSGKDTLYGREGDDVMFGGLGDDTLYGGLGNDALNGGDGNDVLFGGPGNDIIRGGLGQDTLHGGVGTDRLYGGLGADTFIFSSRHDSRPGAGRDSILDFESGIDKIDLSRFDAYVEVPGHQPLVFSSAGPASHSVWLNYEPNGASLRADLNGDGRPDFAVWLSDVSHMTEFDFSL